MRGINSLRSSLVLPLSAQFEAARLYSETLGSASADIMRSRQLESLRRIWRDCVSDVPYYRDIVARGLAPREIGSWEEFHAIPVLDRNMFQQNASQFRRISGPPDRYLSTAGSTGQPVQFGEWKRESKPLRVAKLVPWIRHGYTIDSRLVVIWGHAHLLGTGWRRHYNHAVRKAKDWVAGYHRIDAYTIDRAKAARIAEDIIRLRPAGLIGYSAVLDLFCRYTPHYHAALRTAGLKFVMPCAEPAPRPDTFDLLRSTFGCPVIQEFGGVDFGHVGFKVDDRQHTLFPELNILEAEASPGGVKGAPAVVTTLYPRYVPLIRYRQGDMITGIVRDELGLVVTFDSIEGRINDMITLHDGGSVHSLALTHCFKEEREIFNVQLLLRDQGPLFSLVVKEPLSDPVERAIRIRLGQLHPEFAKAEFSYVSDLEANRAGKRRWIVDRRREKID